MNIYLTGYMGSGKTTYGKALAAAMGREFTDLDEVISKKAGMPVAQIFSEKGEEHFRKLESEALKETEKLKDHVIATGGGTASHDSQINWMNEHGISIYLKLFEDQLYRRLRDRAEERPLLKGVAPEDLQDFIYKHLRERAFYYHQSNIVINPLELEAATLAKVLTAGSI